MFIFVKRRNMNYNRYLNRSKGFEFVDLDKDETV